MKKTRFLILAITVACIALVLAACSEKTPAEMTYKVTVADALGNPYTSGVVVKFMQNGEQKAMQVVNDNGVAEKALPTGDYNVELTFTDSADAYYYDATGVMLTPEKTEATVTLANNPVESVGLFAAGEEITAYHASIGSTYAQLVDGKRNYFLFTPAQAGTYRFSVTDDTAVIGYYGAPHFVQSMSAAEVVNNAFTISVSASMIGTNGTGTTVIVVGIDTGDNDHCLLNIERIGDPEHTLSDEPWTIYKATVDLKPYKLPVGAALSEFDLTASSDAYKLVLNKEDGFYHLGSADGALVLVRLGEDSKYLASFKTILENSGVVKYFFDENEEFVKKESYSECLLEYIGCMDEEKSVYPLTEDLKYIIQQRGDYSGWFDSEQSLYLFKDVNGEPIAGINPEISWLFMCCYIAK